MRTLTLARMSRALLLAAAVIMLPQLASAQLPVETRELKLQGADAGAVTLKAEGTSGAGTYTLTLPKTLTAGTGAMMYTSTTDGGLSWTNAATAGYVLAWTGTAVSWVDPTTSTDNKNWSIAGNTLTAAGTLGAKSNHGVNIITNDAARIAIAASGEITVSNQTTFNTGADQDLVVTESSITRGGAIAINPGTGNDITTDGGITSAENVTITTGGLTLSGTANPISVRGSVGDDGFALVSKGAGASPEWQSINSAVGIRESGTQAFATTASINVTGVPNLAAGDAIIVTVEATGSVVVAQVTARTAAAAGPPATDGSFTVTLSAVTSGTLNYMVIKNQ